MKSVLSVLSNRLLVIFLSCFIIIFESVAQTADFRGLVLDAQNNEAIPYAIVSIPELDRNTLTTEDGYFFFENLEKGEYGLSIIFLAFDTLFTKLNISGNGIHSKTFFLQRKAIELGVVDIGGKREMLRNQVMVSKLVVNRSQINALPSSGGEPDLYQYLQFLPGIVSTGDQGGQLYIRGGSPVQNSILLDGLTILNPFHSNGLHSVFDTDIIRGVSVHSAAFPAKYGSRISGVIDVQTREGNLRQFKATASVNPFAIKGLIEGPILRYNEETGGASFLISSKKSIIASTSKQLYDYASLHDTIGLPYHFGDTYAKISYVAPNGSNIKISGFHFTDSFEDPLAAFVDWKNIGGSINFNIIPSNSNTIIHGILGFSGYDTKLTEVDEKPRQSGLNQLITAINFNTLKDKIEIRYGFDLRLHRTDFEFYNPFEQLISQFQNTTEFAAHFGVLKQWGALIIDSGLRAQYYASASELSLEPRLSAKYLITEQFRVKLASGLYSQNILNASNERDVVQLFNGYLTSPEFQLKGFESDPLQNNLQTALHIVVGLEKDFGDYIHFNVEAYYKDFTQLLTLNRNKLELRDSDFVLELGEAYGLELSAEVDFNKFRLLLNHSYAFATRFDGTQDYYTVFDRRHNMNILLNYNLGEKKDWEINLRWNYGSGFPFTQTQGFYNYLSFFNGPGTEYEIENPSQLGIIYSDERNGGRIPDFHRLDISFIKRFEFGKSTALKIFLNVSNVFDRKNMFYFNRLNYKRVDQLPVLPSLGMKISI